MRRAENTIASFVNGGFKSNLIKFLGTKIAGIEREKDNIVRNIGAVRNNFAYTQKQIDDSVESYRKSLRLQEGRKGSFNKKIKLLTQLDPSSFEKILKKNPQYDGYSIDSDGRLNLYTKMLKDGGKNIGRFRLSIHPDQGRNSDGIEMMAVNMDYHCGNLEHWAISEYRCCLGEWRIDFQNHMWAGDIPQLFQTFILYVTLSPEEHTYTKKKDWYDGRVKRSKEESDRYRESSIFDLDENDDDEDDYSEDD